MKKALVICFVLVSVFACDDGEDHIEATPAISFENLVFSKASAGSGVLPDTLKMTINFSDGDFDLGLSPDQVEPPYHPAYIFIGNNGALTKMPVQDFEGNAFILVPNTTSVNGRLITYRRALASLPSAPTFSCIHYTQLKDLVIPLPTQWIDESYPIIDTMTLNSSDYVVIRDTFLLEQNPSFYNIEVDFLVEQNDGSYVEFDWLKEFCFGSFDGRFSLLDGMSPLKPIQSGPFTIRPFSSKTGELTYKMTSFGFRYLFSGKRIKLRTIIRDRSLNESNQIETPAITIQ